MPNIEILGTKYRFRSERCGDCGFTPGTEANGHGLTPIKARLCAEIPEPFLCHFNANEIDGQLSVPDGKEVLCQGWVEACNVLDEDGFYEKQIPWHREFKLFMNDAISDIEQMKFEHQGEAMAIFNEKMREYLATKN